MRGKRKTLTSIDARWESTFGERRENPDLDPETRSVRYKAHPETGELVPDYMWAQYNMLPKIPPKTHFIQTDFTPYSSAVTGEIVSGRRAHRNHLRQHGIRVYEGRQQEAKEAQRHREYEQRKFERTLEKSLAQIHNDIKYQNNPPPERDKKGNAKVSWTFGE